MNDWRLLEFQTCSAFMNMAIDEAILRARIEERVPNTLRFYGWNPSAVSIGRFQKVENEVHLENCRKQGVNLVRRISGGGTVYHDAEGEITYCIVSKTKDLGTMDVATVYTKVYSGIVEALRSLGVNADFGGGDARNCPNLTVRGKKISGSSQANKSGVTLQHGTVLLDVNLEKMFTLLRVPWAKTPAEVVNVARKKITSLRNELGMTIPIETVSNALSEGFQKTLETKFCQADMQRFEQELAEKLCQEKYSKENWNFNGKTISD